MSDKITSSPGRPEHPLAPLRRFTRARIALGRSGDSLPTAGLLDLGLAHAMARDAVHADLDTHRIAGQLKAAGLVSVSLRSAATDRACYLRRPDLGRRLDDRSREQIRSQLAAHPPTVVFIIADGLSAVAPERYAVPVILAVRELEPDWFVGPIFIAEQARVALGDEVGELLEAEIAVILIGERPGLSAADSLGIYLTYAPRVGRSDAQRNCISNVRGEGLSPDDAARTLHYLMIQARRLRLSGVGLKDDREELASGEGARKQALPRVAGID
ncbi:Ethanolamine ammonia-lyase light chain [Acidisarcina polymorpha]|uniref:Ethanolamine ammonia-lyase small subunit n=1 Tax=Acidisarcina polymorpha TaxID=2211140 RepID=A0A2Z5G6T5_9BACT|nr:ethanolamine ammonia-lyase subunit EutC [Acidisarcina polymorpha]AXC14266.1 Ethanolamine ammonia-lyase light chain [Acidisarcina polymorpha]